MPTEPRTDASQTAPARAGLPLDDLVVLDTTTVIGGPIMSALLADFGARVIKVEQVGKGDDGRKLGKSGKGMYWRFMARNKECVTCDLKSGKGRELFRKMAARADVVMSSFRPGVMEDWGLGYEDLSAINPRLIMLQLSGYGQSGPYAQRPGYGALAEAISGLVYMTGDPAGPPGLPGAPVADPMASAMGALAILLAVRQRDRQGAAGRGQHIDLSLYGPMLYILGSYLTEYSATGHYPVRGEQLGSRILRDVARTRDDKWLVYSVISGTLIGRVDAFLRGRGYELPGDGRYLPSTPAENYIRLGATLKQWVATVERDEALDALDKAGIPSAPIYSIADIFTNPHFRARGDFETVSDPEAGEMQMPRAPFRMSGVAQKVRHPGRRMGADNGPVYRDWLGISEAEVAALAAEGVI